jgi:hypothetical protein
MKQKPAPKPDAIQYDKDGNEMAHWRFDVPAPKREWVGLTDEEIILLSGYDLNYAALIGEVQKKLKEKNT